MNHIFTFFCIILLCSSCASQKKYESLQYHIELLKDQYEKDTHGLIKQIEHLDSIYTALEQELRLLKVQLKNQNIKVGTINPIVKSPKEKRKIKLKREEQEKVLLRHLQPIKKTIDKPTY